MKMDETTLTRLKAEDAKSQAENRGKLLAQREKDGQVTLKCPKCGAESVADAKAKSPKCGAMSGAVKDGIQAPCGTALN